MTFCNRSLCRYLAKLLRRKTMKVVFAVALTLAFMAGVAAHAVDRSPQSVNASPRLTVIGCIQRSTPSPAATVGTTALPEGATKYVLSNITLTADPPTATAPAAAAMRPIRGWRRTSAIASR
jgi:hypothetical protein